MCLTQELRTGKRRSGLGSPGLGPEAKAVGGRAVTQSQGCLTQCLCSCSTSYRLYFSLLVFFPNTFPFLLLLITKSKRRVGQAIISM